MIYLQLFYEYFKIGLFAVGGGMATLPFLYDLSDKTGWFTYMQIADMLAVSESTPGPIGINIATYVGYTTAGPLGSLLATLGMILPGIFITALVFKALQKFRDNEYVNAAFYGLRPASTGLVAAAGLSVIAISLFDFDLYEVTGNIIDLFSFQAILLAVIIWFMTNKIKLTKDLHPIYYIAGSAVVGMVFSFAGV